MSVFDTTPFRRAALDAPDVEIVALVETVKAALEGDSNDDEHEGDVVDPEETGDLGQRVDDLEL